MSMGRDSSMGMMIRDGSEVALGRVSTPGVKSGGVRVCCIVHNPNYLVDVWLLTRYDELPACKATGSC